MSAEITNTSDDDLSLKEQLEAAHRNVIFLQEEHALTIKGLHEEVEKLQNYIKDLHFQQEILEVVVPNDEFFQCDIATLKHKVKKLLTESSDLKRKLLESNKALELLDQKQKLEKWQYLQELSERDKTIQCLQKELESKCSTVAQLTSQLANKKKSNFMRLFNFNSELPPSPPISKRVDATLRCADVDGATSKSLPADDSVSLHCDYSSYSSLSSDRSTSDDDVFRIPMLMKQYSFPSPKYGYRGRWNRSSQGSLKLPPLPNRELVVRQQIRVDKIIEKPLDSLAIDHVTCPEIVDESRS